MLPVKLSLSPKSAREPLTDLITLATANGFKGVQLNCGDRSHISLKSTGKKRDALARSLADAGLALSGLACELSFPGPAGVEDFKGDLAAHLELAAALGAGALVIYGSPWAGWDRRANYIDNISVAIEEVLSADDSKVQVAMQNRLGNCNAFDCIEFAQYVAHNRFGLIYSSGAGHQEPGLLAGILQANSAWLTGISISDVNDKGKGVAVGSGDVALSSIVKFQKSRRFRNWYIWDRSSNADDVAGFKAAIGAK